MPRRLAGSSAERIEITLTNLSGSSYGTAGEGAVGVPYSAVTLYYWRAGASPVAANPTGTLVANTSAISAGLWREVDGTNMKGLYSYDLTGNAFATAGDVIVLAKVTGCVAFRERYEVVSNLDFTTGDYAGLADAIFDELMSGHTTAGSAGKYLQDVLTASQVENAVWDANRASHATAGTYGEGVNIELIGKSALAATNLRDGSKSLLVFTVTTSNFAATTTEFESSTSVLPTTADALNSRDVMWLDGPLAGSFATISDFSSSGGFRHFTVPTMIATPGNGNTGVIV